MNVDELQAASDTAERFAPDSDRGLDDRWLVEEIIVEAARMWLNPNIDEAEATLEKLADMQKLADMPIGIGFRQAAHLVVAAALTPGDNK